LTPDIVEALNRRQPDQDQAVERSGLQRVHPRERNGNTGYLFTNWEDRPGGMGRILWAMLRHGEAYRIAV
jgi:hypothetical protein